MSEIVERAREWWRERYGIPHIDNMAQILAAFAESEINSLSARNRELEDRVLALTEALTMMVEEKCDYMRINHLGNPMTQHTIKVASKALASSDLGASIRRGIEREAIERCAKVAEKLFGGKAHTYASENADLYRAQDDACSRITAAIRALLPPEQAMEEATVRSRQWAADQARQLNAECEADIERLHGAKG